MNGMPDRYLRPGRFTRNVFNRIVAALTRLGNAWTRKHAQRVG
jgi:hypothetical protein